MIERQADDAGGLARNAPAFEDPLIENLACADEDEVPQKDTFVRLDG